MPRDELKQSEPGLNLVSMVITNSFDLPEAPLLVRNESECGQNVHSKQHMINLLQIGKRFCSSRGQKNKRGVETRAVWVRYLIPIHLAIL